MFGFVNRVDKLTWPLLKDLSANISSLSSDEGLINLMLETSVLRFLYGGQITLKTLLKKANIQST